MGKPRNVKSEKFGMLTVICDIGYGQRICRCDCGRNRVVMIAKLRRDEFYSCGCTKRTGLKHGHSRPGAMSPTYSSWRNMVARCTYPSNPAFTYYKKLGIKLCRRWRRFENFLSDMGERPSEKHSIDRWPDNDGDYKPGNCRWATRTEQANNRRTNRNFEFRGKSYTFMELVRETGCDKEFLRGRLLRGEWTVEQALSLPKYSRPTE